jgi:ATP diphosphatase
MTDIVTLLDVMARLRDPESGCPWDREQTLESLLPHTLEEAYEVIDAVSEGDDAAICDELGDLLFQIVFYSRIAEEQGRFSFADVVAAIVDKLVRRHPHVFADEHIANADEQALAWERHKQRERAGKQDGLLPVSVLDGVTMGLPALTRAVKLQRRAARVGFDWADVAAVLDKVQEELDEVRDEVEKGASPGPMEHEIGDLLLAASNLARHAGIDPELAVHAANRRFERRFRHVEASCRRRGKAPEDCASDELEGYWQLAKQDEG